MSAYHNAKALLHELANFDVCVNVKVFRNAKKNLRHVWAQVQYTAFFKVGRLIRLITSVIFRQHGAEFSQRCFQLIDRGVQLGAFAVQHHQLCFAFFDRDFDLAGIVTGWLI